MFAHFFRFKVVVDFLLAAVSLALSIPAGFDVSLCFTNLINIQKTEGAADMICNNRGVAGSVAGVAFAWSVCRWRDVFGDIVIDMLTRYASSQRWLVLGRQWEWDPAMDVRVRWCWQSGSQLCLRVGAGLGAIWIIVSLVACVT